MKVKELLKALEGVDPEAEVIGGVWNGRVDTYKVMDDTWYTEFDNLWGDFYGTPGELRNVHMTKTNKKSKSRICGTDIHDKACFCG